MCFHALYWQIYKKYLYKKYKYTPLCPWLIAIACCFIVKLLFIEIEVNARCVLQFAVYIYIRKYIGVCLFAHRHRRLANWTSERQISFAKRMEYFCVHALNCRTMVALLFAYFFLFFDSLHFFFHWHFKWREE